MIRPQALFLTAALLAPSLGSPQGIRYAPAEDQFLTRIYRLATELDLEDMRTVMNGQEIPAEYIPELEIHVLRAGVLVVTDKVVELGANRPAVLERTFDSLARQGSQDLTMSGETTLSRGTAASPFEGRTVRFTWDEDEEDFIATSVDDDEAIEGLLEDMDLRGFLPAGEVEEGDTWQLDAKALTGLLSPGGDLRWAWEGDDMQGNGRRSEDPEGEVLARFAGMQEGDLALIEITGEVTTHEEEAGDLEHIPIVDGTATTRSTTTYGLEGRLYWSVAAGRLDSLEMKTDVNVESTTLKDPEQPGPEFESTVYLVGSWECRVSIKED